MYILPLIILLFFPCPVSAESKNHTLTGDIRFHHVFYSAQANQHRAIVVYLPPGYEKEKLRRFPVLYMHDGQNIFDSATSFIGIEWQVDETVERLIKQKKIPKIIVVGIYNSADRISEYTSTADPERGGGKSEQYIRFILNDLKPFIDKTYRTIKNRKNTAVCGSSLGGNVSFHMLWHYSKYFSKGAILSPAVHWANRAILDDIERNKPVRKLKIWLDMGTREGDTLKSFEDGIENARDFRDALVKSGFAIGKNLGYFEDVGAVHNESAWAKRMPRILEFLFGNE